MSPYQPNRKEIDAEQRVLNDRRYLDERPTLVAFLERLREARTPGDFYHLQRDLFGRVKAHQSLSDRLKRTREEQGRELGRLGAHEDVDRGRLSAMQRAVADLDHSLRVERALRSAFSSVADGIAWRALAYQRQAITVLGDAQRVNRLSNEGLAAELGQVEAYWQDGIFAVLNDLTTCLRLGDVTAVIPPNTIEVAEVKTSSGQSVERQQRRLDGAAELLNRGRCDDEEQRTVSLVRIHRPLRSRLRHVAELLRAARTEGYAAKQVSSCQFVCAFHVSGDFEELARRETNDLAKLGWGTSTLPAFAWLSLVRVLRDRRYSFASLAPLSIYPFDVEDLADLLLGYIAFRTVLDPARLHKKLALPGVDMTVETGPAAAERFVTARWQLDERILSVEAEPTLRERLLMELMYPEDARAAVHAMLRAVATEAGPERVDRLPVFDDEWRVWESWRAG